MLKMAITMVCLGLFASEAALAAPKVIIQVDLNAHVLRIEKVEGAKRKHLDGRTLPTVKDSLRAGWYRPVKLVEKFKTVGRKTYLENVVFFSVDGSKNRARTLRTTRYFERIARSGAAVSGAVVLEPDFGNILFSTIRQHGLDNTWILIRK